MNALRNVRNGPVKVLRGVKFFIEHYMFRQHWHDKIEGTCSVTSMLSITSTQACNVSLPLGNNINFQKFKALRIVFLLWCFHTFAPLCIFTYVSHKLFVWSKLIYAYNSWTITQHTSIAYFLHIHLFIMNACCQLFSNKYN